MENNKIRISMLGGSGSGKTSFFSGIIHSMIVNAKIVGKGADRSSISLNAKSIKQSNSYFLEEEDSEGLVRSMNNAALLSKYLISDDPDVPNGGFGVSTTDSIEFTFDLLINNIPCCEIVIADYAGELIDDPSNKAMKSNLVQLCTNIAESDAIIIMSDSVIISRHLNNNFSIQKETGAQMINMIFPNIKTATRKNNRPLTTLVAMTKTDSPRIPDMMRKSNFANISSTLFDSIYSKTFASMDMNSDSWGIIPVSAIGRGNVDDDNYIIENANIQPENIDTAIIFSISSSISKILADKEKNIKSLEEELKKIFGFTAKVRTAKENIRKQISELTTQKQALEQCRNATSQMNDIFPQTINNMHCPNITEIGEVVKK